MDAVTGQRALDANLNRAREALRVIEDIARFEMNDRESSEVAKQVRHELAVRFGEAARHWLESRDVTGDVGIPTKLGSEARRGSIDDVLAAEFARLGEALRVLGEVGKVTVPSFTKFAEQMRYRCYGLEPTLRLRGGRRGRFSRVGLYVIITESLCRAEFDGRQDWLAVAESALQGGAGCIQLREKGLADGELLRRARLLRERTARHEALLIINDRPDIARICDADGVHLGQGDLPIDEARRVVGADRLVGISTHSDSEFDAARAAAPDYIAVGPMFVSRTKPDLPAAGLELLRVARSRTSLPLVAIGGIGAANVAEVRAAAEGIIVCACTAVIGADRPSDAARLLASP